MLRNVEVSITDRMGRPVPNLDVSAIALARSGQIDEVEAVETTDFAGVCRFNLDEPCYYRPMLSPMLKRDVRVVVINFGGQGIRKHFVVDAEGFGTHTTIQAACTAATAALSINEAVVIYINPGLYREALVVDASDLKRFYFVGEGAVVDLWAGQYASIVRIASVVTGKTGTVVSVTGTGFAAFHGIKIDGDGSDDGITAADSVSLELRNCWITTASGVDISSQDHVRAFDSIFSVDTGRLIGGNANGYEFSHCRLNGDGLFKGDFVALVLKDCFLFGDAPASEYWIEEEALVISLTLHIIGCRGTAGGGGGFVKFGAAGANSDDIIITDNHMGVSAGEIWCRVRGVLGGVITDNIITGVSDTDGSTAIELNEGTAKSCGALNVAHNSIRVIQNGVVVNASGTDGTCVIGPNAYYGVGTETSGVPDAENYEVNVSDLFGGDAADLTYTPGVDADWDGGTDPGDTDDALDQLAERIKDVEDLGGGGDAGDITYTPGVDADWDSDADPGDSDDAFDQLAERVTDLEERGVYEYASSATAVFGGNGVDPVCGPWFGNTPFIGTVNGNPTSTTVVYNHTSGEASLFRGQVLHNLTKGERVYIEDVVIGTNTFTVEANSPDDANTWDDTDALTTASQTNQGRAGVFVDLDVTPHIAASSNPGACIISGYTALQAADTWFLIVHPCEAYDLDKEQTVIKHWQGDTIYHQNIIPLTAADGRYYFTLCLLGLAGSNAAAVFRWAGQFTKLVS